jgi:hypothetical protein
MTWRPTDPESESDRKFAAEINGREAIEKVNAIRAVLWPDGEPDASWSADTLDAIAQIVGQEESNGLQAQN